MDTNLPPMVWHRPMWDGWEQANLAPSCGQAAAPAPRLPTISALHWQCVRALWIDVPLCCRHLTVAVVELHCPGEAALWPPPPTRGVPADRHADVNSTDCALSAVPLVTVVPALQGTTSVPGCGQAQPVSTRSVLQLNMAQQHSPHGLTCAWLAARPGRCHWHALLAVCCCSADCCPMMGCRGGAPACPAPSAAWAAMLPLWNPLLLRCFSPAACPPCQA